MSEVKADIGLIGLAVMGQNLVLNMSDQQLRVAVYNRSPDKTDTFLNGPAKGRTIVGYHDLPGFFAGLQRPRKVLLMVKAGEPVDQFIQASLPYLEPGDILIDGGNSHFDDTQRRYALLQEQGILFVGAGISGGEEGARHGPSMMPGGNPEAWEALKPMLQKIAAKSPEGLPCCDWVGEGGAGHYVKMVHNGIEYGDMQLICEAYSLMKNCLHLSAKDLHQIFKDWNGQELNSYLIEITSHIFSCHDEDGTPLVDKILDVAGQKGTGKWVGIHALELGSPLTLIGEAVFARCLSSRKEERVRASHILQGPTPGPYQGEAKDLVEAIRQALYASKIISYAQGFSLIQEASDTFGWSIDPKKLAIIWQGGCIIRSRFLGSIKDAYTKNPELQNLMLDDFFCEALAACQASWRHVVATAVQMGVSVPCLSTGLAYYDGYRSARLPANLLQAQRDFFGAHTYERVDKPRGEFFHSNWTGTGGMVSSSQYNL